VIYKKNNTFFSQIIYLLNITVLLLIGICFLLANYHVAALSSVSILIIFLPVLLCVNFLFFIYWIIKLDLRFVYSFLVLLIYIEKPISFFENDVLVNKPEGLHVMSYNVRLFNHYNWIKDSSVRDKIKLFVNEKNPEFIAIQEFHNDYRNLMSGFSSSHFGLNDGNVGLAIFGKRKMINKGEVISNDGRIIAIYVDFIKQSDTLRLYNSHFKSYNLNPLSFKANKETFKDVIGKTKLVYEIQNNECLELINHMEKSPYSLILAIDLNNTPDSFVYNEINNSYSDSYSQNNFDFGATYGFSFLPIRIDYIFYSKLIKVNSYEIHKVRLSDHKPISLFLKI